MKRFVLSMCVATVAMAVACDDEDPRDEAEATPDQVNAANAAVDDCGELTNVTESSSAGSAYGTLQGMYTSYDALVQSVAVQDAAAAAPRGLFLPRAVVECGTGSYEWTDSSITYNDCDGMDGTISWSGDTYSIDITYDFAAAGVYGYTGTFTYLGELTISDTEIDGNFNIDYEFGYDFYGQSLDYDSNYDVTYNAVGLDSSGCAESGSMDVVGDWSYNASGQSYEQSINITVQFDGCDNATILY